MEIWNAPTSIFAPLIFGLPPDAKCAGFREMAHAAADSIPVSEVTYTVKRHNSFKKAPEIRKRRLINFPRADSKPYVARTRLVDAPPPGTPLSADGLALWEVGIFNLVDGLCTPAIPADYDSGILELTLLRLNHEGQIGAPQLALFRHLFASAILAASPDAIVFGGQQDWNDDWWTEVVETSI